jgi:hypothetical protein
MFFFGLNLFHVLYLYNQLKSYKIILLTLVNVIGFIYSIEKIQSPKRKKRIIDFSPKEKKKMIHKELKGISKKKPKVEIYKPPKKKERFIASVNSKKYHKENCRYAENISYKNKLTFSSKKEAKKKGYKPGRCIK